MENASKALIIAGEVLIAVLVITFMVSLFVTFGNFSANIHEKLSNEQVIKFNNNFTIYEGRINITAQEIVTAINFAKQANDARELDYDTMTSSDYYTTVLIEGKDVFHYNDYVDNRDEYNNGLTQKLQQFLENNNTEYFSCGVKNLSIVTKGIDNKKEITFDYDENGIRTNENTGLVNKIEFKSVKKEYYELISKK